MDIINLITHSQVQLSLSLSPLSSDVKEAHTAMGLLIRFG